MNEKTFAEVHGYFCDNKNITEKERICIMSFIANNFLEGE